MKWDASVRGRIGYLVKPDLLVYGTGGIAWQSIDVSGTCENTLSDPTCLLSPPFGAKTQTDRSILTGWTLGAGIEREHRDERRHALTPDVHPSGPCDPGPSR